MSKREDEKEAVSRRNSSDYGATEVEWRSRVHREWLRVRAYKVDEVDSGLNDGTKDSVWRYYVEREDFDGKYDVPKKYRKDFQVIHDGHITVQNNQPIDLEDIISDFLNDMTRKFLTFAVWAEKYDSNESSK